jgi:predicted nucleotidyltransferase
METPIKGIVGMPAALRRQVVTVVARHLGGRHYRLYLFGSRARGTATPRSDYDIGVRPEAPLDLVTLAALRADLEELPVMQRLEVVDLASASPDFVQRALQDSELLDER